MANSLPVADKEALECVLVPQARQGGQDIVGFLRVDIEPGEGTIDIFHGFFHPPLARKPIIPPKHTNSSIMNAAASREVTASSSDVQQFGKSRPEAPCANTRLNQVAGRIRTRGVDSSGSEEVHQERRRHPGPSTY